jgi:RNA polymerase sigma-70 factor, ECF subfamily
LGEQSSPENTAAHYQQSDPDVRLMLQVRDDNAAAFEELVRRYQDRVITVLEHLIQDRDLAEDLAQEVFMRIFKARKTYTVGAKFSTWLFTITNNVASNSRRSGAKRKEVQVSTTQSGTFGVQSLENMAKANSGFMPARRMDKAEITDVIREAMSTLNERQRMAIVLAKFEEMSYTDIATTMGLSLQAVKSLLARARQNLKLILSPYIESGVRPQLSPVALDETGENDWSGENQLVRGASKPD